MTINDSANVSNFDFEAQLDIANPVPKAIVTDISTYIGSGSTNIIGIIVRIVDPANLNLPLTVYPPNVDIYPGLTSTSKNLPYFGGQVRWGIYKIYATLIDSDGDRYEWTDAATGVGYKSINLCKPNSLSNATLNYGGLNLDVNPDCDTGMMVVQDGGTGFSYNGVTPSETEAALTITYPIDTTGTTAQQTATFIPFTFPLTVSGIYSIVGTVTQTYQLTETTSVKAAYYYQNTFDVQCGYSLCKALCDFEKLWQEIKDCSPANPNLLFQKLKTFVLILGLLVKVQAFKNCGKKFGDLLEQFRIIGGFSCNCECAPQGIAPAPLGLGGGTLVKGNECGDIEMTLTQFLGNVKIDLSDVSYSVVAAAAQEDFITITPSEGTCSKTFTISIDFAAAIQAAELELCIENTAFVTPCGNDATGELGNFLLPFATIKAAVASTTSDSGHAIHVYPGTYIEGKINWGSDNIEKIGLSYFFEPGVTVSATGLGIGVFGSPSAGTMVIRGGAIFKSDFGVFGFSAAYDLDAEFVSAEITGSGSGNCLFVSGGGTYKIKCSTIKSSAGSCVDIRSVSSTGYIECDLMDNQLSTISIPCVKISLTGTHLWTFYVKELKTMSNALSNSAGVLLIAGGAKVYWKGNIFQNQVTGTRYCSGVSVNTGTLIFEGDIVTVDGHGCVCVNGTIVVRNSTIRAGGAFSALESEEPLGVGVIIANNCMLVNNSASAATIGHSASDTGSMQLSNCLISNESAGGGAIGVSLTNVAQAIRMNNCNIYLVSATGVSISASVNVTVRLVNCWSNMAVGGAGVITNAIQAINVDADLIQTIYT